MGLTAASPQLNPGLLLLGLLLLSAVVTVASEDPSDDGDLQCVCLKTMSKVNAKHITNLEVIKAGPHCANTEIIATLKNGSKICLEGEVSFFKGLVRKLVAK
uniref:Platelet factor 4 n=1 Tax=Marmota marmota marmota TaxID=9994 RepID=A0A8C6AEX4_MARMA